MKNTRGEREGAEGPHSQTAANVMYMKTVFPIHEKGDMYIKTQDHLFSAVDLDGGSRQIMGGGWALEDTAAYRRLPLRARPYRGARMKKYSRRQAATA